VPGALAFAVLLIGPVEADYTAIGLGTASCGTWTSYRHDRQGRSYEQWVLGFLSGVGFEATNGKNPLNAMDGHWRTDA
jgi:hypothetical protein